MNKRIRLLIAVKKFAECELLANIQQWDFVKVNQYTERIEALQNRIPKPVMPAARISSQQKLFY